MLDKELIYAVQLCDPKAVEFLLLSGANANATNEYGVSALHLAMEKEDLILINLLVERGAKLEVRNINGYTPNSDLALMNLLVEKGAKVDGEDIYSGYTPLIWAVIKGNLKSAEFLLSEGANVNATTGYGRSALHFASVEETDDFDLAKLLVENGANLEEKTNDGYTPLICAVEKGNSKVVEFLLSKGANINATTEDGISALHIVSRDDDLDLIKFFITEGAKLESKDIAGNTPLIWAVNEGNSKIVEYLLSKGANVNALTSDGRTALHFASEEVGDDCSLAKLLVANGAKVNKKTNDGYTPLICAVKEGNINIVKFLLSEGADVDATTSDGRSALNFASVEEQMILILQDAWIWKKKQMMDTH